MVTTRNEELEDLIVRNSGLSSQEPAMVQEIMKRIEETPYHAKLVLDAMIYQFAKAVGECACTQR